MAKNLIVLLVALFLSSCIEIDRSGVVPIGSVQGQGSQSPMVDQQVIVEGIVIGGTIAGLGGVVRPPHCRICSE